MDNDSSITRIDHKDPRNIAVLEAERRLFARYGLAYKTHFVELHEPRLSVRVLEAGEGRPLLMVPGGAGDAWPYIPLMAELDGWRMMAVNRPGGGLSDGVDFRTVDVRRLAVDTLRAVADAFELERVPIISNSMGGLWSFWYALEYPERVSNMAQMGCPALMLDTSAPLFMRLLGVPGINGFIAPVMQPKSADSALQGLRSQGCSQQDIDRMSEETAEAAYQFFNLPTYLDTWKTLISAVATLKGANPKYQLGADQLRRVQQPVQFVWGEKDPFGDLDIARQAVEIMPDARLHEMRTGHLPFLDRPEETGHVIREFLSHNGGSNGDRR
jgi:2-hydroxy-6-oxonona-2,4-dienedioate hydrolase